MKLLKLSLKKPLLFFILTSCYTISIAQTKGVIIDAETNLPIPFVSIYTNGQQVRGTMGDEFGSYAVHFTYDSLFFSHINYESIRLTTTMRKDTILMNPTTHLLSDIVITSQNNKWIEKILKQVVKNKTKNYQVEETIADKIKHLCLSRQTPVFASLSTSVCQLKYLCLPAQTQVLASSNTCVC